MRGWEGLQFKGKINDINYTKQKLMISPGALLHSESEHDTAEPGRARKGMAMGMEQQKTVYEMDVTESRLVKNPGQLWAEPAVQDRSRPR